MVSIVPLQRRTEAAARSIFSLERRRREEDGRGGMDFSGNHQGELPIPMHAAASPYGAGAAAGGHVMQLHPEQVNNSNGHDSPALPPSPPAAAAEEGSSGKKRAAAAGAGTGAAAGGGPVVKYRECLKNHAAAIGGNATDGCGEFMPSGEEGSLEALKCSACSCHRNFHRKAVGDDMDVDGCVAGHGYVGYGHSAGRRLLAPAVPHGKNGGGGGGGLLVAAADPYGAYGAVRAVAPPLPAGHPLHHHHHQQFVNAVPLSAVHTGSAESDEMDGAAAGLGGGGSSSCSKKRFRTRFTAEQKGRMLEFAERVGWRLQKLDDGMVQAFCQEIGVKRRVLKVWMHNNKHNLATKRIEDAPQAPAPAIAPPQMPMPMPPPPPPPASQPGPSSFLRDGSSSPPPQMMMPMAMPPPPPPQFHRGPGSPPPIKLD